MTTFIRYHGDLFYRAIAAVAMIGPILLIIAADQLPENPETGEFVVYGHGVIVAILAIAMSLRAAYARGFIRAWQIAGAEPKYSVTA
jgi:hypothetical protein